MENPQLNIGVTNDDQRYCITCGSALFVESKFLFMAKNPLIGQPPITLVKEGPMVCLNCNSVIMDWETKLRKAIPKSEPRPPLTLVPDGDK